VWYADYSTIDIATSLLQEHEIAVNCKVFEMNGKKKALIQPVPKEDATEALVCKHANSLSGFVVHISFL